MPPADVELVLDVRELRSPPTDKNSWERLWSVIEPVLQGRDLRARREYALDGPDGVLRMEVARITANLSVVTPDTRFSVVGVRENPQLRYRCKVCADQAIERYGPFRCAASVDDDEHRVCNRHVSILDGSLTATCPAHRPYCRECLRPATFRCAGAACRHDVAWCDEHRRAHPQDKDIDYCPSCYAQKFPQCEVAGCMAIGTAVCEHMTRGYERCGRRMCARHAKRWQVFGGERLGLGRCASHATLTRLPPEEIVFQIVAGAAGRGGRQQPPSLQGFAHTLRRAGHRELALDYLGILQLLTALATGERALSAKTDAQRRTAATVAQSLRRMQPVWDTQYKKTGTATAEGQQLVARLRRIVEAEIPRYGSVIASAISLAEYRPPVIRDGQVMRPGLLFVHVPEEWRGRFVGREGAHARRYAEVLGVRVRIEGGRHR